MTMRGSYPRRTICEVLREINDIVQGTDEVSVTIRKKLALCERMAKKMQTKLIEYSGDHHTEWWKKNPNHKANLEKRLTETYITEDPEPW